MLSEQSGGQPHAAWRWLTAMRHHIFIDNSLVVLMTVLRAKRPTAIDKLGFVSDRGISEHRVD